MGQQKLAAVGPQGINVVAHIGGPSKLACSISQLPREDKRGAETQEWMHRGERKEADETKKRDTRERKEVEAKGRETHRDREW